MLNLAIEFNQNILSFLFVGFVVVFVGILLKRFQQPLIVAYIITGILLGPFGIGFIEDIKVVEELGELGLILLLFFIGMEISLPDLVKLWKTSLFGTLIQIAASLLAVYALGYFFNWDIQRVIVVAFVISLSSSAVVIKLLEGKNEVNTAIGQNVISILLMQDMLIVPMLIITELVAGVTPTTQEIILKSAGGLLIIGIFIVILLKGKIKVPFSNWMEKDHELQVFIAILFSFGFASFTAFLGLSAALGAFFAGIIVHATDTKEWFHDALHGFRVSFVSMFFVSIGMLINLQFVVDNWVIISLLVLSAFITNHVINTFTLNFFCKNWLNSIYGGALLAQIGELSFVIAATAYYRDVIQEYTYQLSIATISITLLLSPFWILMTKKIVDRFAPKSKIPEIGSFKT
jgi:CPA2 family monovalent cation:H+ antiporter-2